VPIPSFQSNSVGNTIPISICAETQPSRSSMAEEDLIGNLKNAIKKNTQDCPVIIFPSYSRVRNEISNQSSPRKIPKNRESDDTSRFVIFGDVRRVHMPNKNEYVIQNSVCGLFVKNLLSDMDEDNCFASVIKQNPVPILEKPLPLILSSFQEEQSSRPVGFLEVSKKRVLYTPYLNIAAAICWEASIPEIFSSITMEEWVKVDLILIVSDLSSLGPSISEAMQAKRDMRLLARRYKKPVLYVGVFDAFMFDRSGKQLNPIKHSSTSMSW